MTYPIHVSVGLPIIKYNFYQYSTNILLVSNTSSHYIRYKVTPTKHVTVFVKLNYAIYITLFNMLFLKE